MSDALLEVEDLHVTFHTASGPVHAVDGVSFTMAPGAALGVVGESGSGKSVTARAILRLFAITDDVEIAGSVRFAGVDLLRIDERKLRRVRGGQIGMIFQDPLTSLNPLMMVGEQIAESLRLHRGMGRAEAASEAVALLGRVGISDPERRAQELPHSFSGGMRQRVMISLAIACRPRLLIADEPTTALDVTVQAEILLLLDELRRSQDMALMFITHDFGVVSATCDDVQVMYAGRLVEKASMAHLFDRANHPYTEGLLRLVPASRTPTPDGCTRFPASRPSLAGVARRVPSRRGVTTLSTAAEPRCRPRWRSDPITRAPAGWLPNEPRRAPIQAAHGGGTGERGRCCRGCRVSTGG